MPILVKDPRWGEVQFPDDATNEEITNYFVSLEAQEGPQFSTGEVLYRAAERGLTSTARGLEQKIIPDSFREWYYSFGGGFEPGAIEGEQGLAIEDEMDRAKEQELRVMLEQRPELAYPSLIGGSIADPITLPLAFTKLIKLGGAVSTGAARGASAGAVGGAIEPTYEEYGDSTALNIVAGGVLGGGLGAAVGKFFPKTMGFGQQKLDDEVDNAIESVARREQELQTNQVVDDAAEIQVISNRASAGMLQPTAQPSLRPLQVIDPISKIQEDLAPLAARGLPKQELSTLQGSLKTIDNELSALDKFKPKRGKAGFLDKQARVKELSRQRLDIQQRLNEARDAQVAQRDLNAIKAGRTQDLTKPTQAKLQEYTAQQIAQPKPIAQAIAPQPVQFPPQTEELISGINARIATPPKPLLQPTPQAQVPTQAAAPTAAPAPSQAVSAPQGRAPLGLEARPGVGSTGTAPSAQFAATAADAPGEAAVRRAVFGTRGGAPTPDRAEVVGETLPERAFHSRLQAESAEQLIRLRDEAYYQGLPTNRYSWNNVTTGAVEVEGRILEDYDDLASWLADQDNRLLSALELETITPLIEEAQSRMFDSRKILYALQRSGQLDSEEAVKVMQDIQYYNYIGNAGYIAQKTKISNALTQLRKMKQYMNVQNSQIEKGKQVNQIMFGVTC